MHASASPFEALAERNNWLGVHLAKDTLGQLTLSAKVSPKTAKEGSVSPQANLEAGSRGPLFASVEDLDADSCLAKLAALVICGHSDSGKSATPGRLSFELGGLSVREPAELKQGAECLGQGSFAYALYVASQKEECERDVILFASAQ